MITPAPTHTTTPNRRRRGSEHSLFQLCLLSRLGFKTKPGPARPQPVRSVQSVRFLIYPPTHAHYRLRTMRYCARVPRNGKKEKKERKKKSLSCPTSSWLAIICVQVHGTNWVEPDGWMILTVFRKVPISCRWPVFTRRRKTPRWFSTLSTLLTN